MDFKGPPRKVFPQSREGSDGKLGRKMGALNKHDKCVNLNRLRVTQRGRVKKRNSKTFIIESRPNQRSDPRKGGQRVGANRKEDGKKRLKPKEQIINFH